MRAKAQGATCMSDRSGRQGRDERLSSALRDNLRRRKAASLPSREEAGETGVQRRRDPPGAIPANPGESGKKPAPQG